MAEFNIDVDTKIGQSSLDKQCARSNRSKRRRGLEMHFAIIIRDKHHKNYVNVSERFIVQLAQALANVHKVEVKAVKYYDKNSTAWTKQFKPERFAFISEYAHFNEVQK